MPYEISLKLSAVKDMDRLRKFDVTRIADAMERYLQSTPSRVSKSRIKRLRGSRNPDYRLRVGDYRVFYAVDEDGRRVDVLRVMHKDETQSYYEEQER
ncbi:MAG: type II toxin-antitoxin system mRNA interferase toxin, RelE/StbE family [Candidatus Latescibacterota bacterium]|jgi:addiction module RelE/StbE family toxin